MAKELFHRGHYNILAKQFKDNFELIENSPYNSRGEQFTASGACITLLMNITSRLKEDNPRFNPRKFLDACSPNTDTFPLSELWEDD